MKKSLYTSALKTKRTWISQALGFPVCKIGRLGYTMVSEENVSILHFLPSPYLLVQEVECGLGARQRGLLDSTEERGVHLPSQSFNSSNRYEKRRKADWTPEFIKN